MLRWSTGYTIGRMHDAARLVRELPATLNGVEAGRFGYLYATSLVTATKDLDPTVTGKVEAKVLERAPDADGERVPRRGTPCGRHARPARRGGAARRMRSRSGGCVYQPAEHAMAWINTYLPAADAQAVHDRRPGGRGQTQSRRRPG